MHTKALLYQTAKKQYDKFKLSKYKFRLGILNKILVINFQNMQLLDQVYLMKLSKQLF